MPIISVLIASQGKNFLFCINDIYSLFIFLALHVLLLLGNSQLIIDEWLRTQNLTMKFTLPFDVAVEIPLSVDDFV